MQRKKLDVRIEKADLDTITAGAILKIDREAKVKYVRGEANGEDLKNPEVICIETGGSGQIQKGNFDHHGETELNCAARQVYEKQKTEMEKNTKIFWDFLTRYVNILDTKGPERLREILSENRISYNRISPTISDVVSGISLSIREPIEVFHKGIEFLMWIETLWIKDGWRPLAAIDREGLQYMWGPVPVEGSKWNKYVEAKKEHDSKLKEATAKAKWTTTRLGLRVGYVETDWIGAIGALYSEVESRSQKGAQIAVVLNPTFGPNKIRKFTIAGNGIRVDSLLPKLNALETGWGGPAHGTIIGSPRDRSSQLKLKTVLKIVQESL